ncbi:MAG TPA: DUF1805 domain-containing protein [Patescibacteria group bacterium]|nr:DUF1805 domain-containing protein [Patescibacteria group bacterium]
MFRIKKIKVGRRYVEALSTRLLTKNLVLLKGRKGYVMCGYLNMASAEKFNDAAAMVTGVATIADALKAQVRACTTAARTMGIYEGQAVREALMIFA